MLDVQFRALEHRDIDSVQRLVDDLFNKYPAEEGAKPSISRTFSEFSRRPDKGRVLVFEYGQQVIGYAILVFIWTNEFGADVLWIDELAVDEKYRGFGIGKKFFAWLQANHNTPALSLLVSEDNRGAKKFYEEIGFKTVQTQMIKVNASVLNSAVETKPEPIVMGTKELVEAA